jgi:glucose/arabinose dehydrogenase
MRGWLAAALVLLALPATASAAPTLVPVGTFEQPVHVAAPPGDAARLFVVERAGRVQVLVNGQKAATPFLDIATGVSDTGERGLLSIAFPNDYATSGLFYVFYTDLDGNLIIREGQRTAADPNRGELGRNLFTVEHSSASNHNGGQLAFGPDGALYISTGDGASNPANAQDPNSRLGKILRMNPRTDAEPVVWALGLRNPWRFSFDRVTGDMLIGDVGAVSHEEIDFALAGTPAGRNYGWPDCEGAEPTPCPVPNSTAPALSLPRSEYTTVIGGVVVRDPGLPTLLGRYVFGDHSRPTVMSAVIDASGGRDLRPELPLTVSTPSSFGEDACGRVYVAELGDNEVSRIQDGAPSPCPAPAAPPPGSPPPVAADTTACDVRTVGRKRAQRILRRGKRLRLTLRASERCTVTLRAKRFRTKRVTLQPNAKRIVRLTPTKTGLRKLRRTLARSDRRRVRIAVRISARDDAGNRSTARVRRTVR